MAWPLRGTSGLWLLHFGSGRSGNSDNEALLLTKFFRFFSRRAAVLIGSWNCFLVKEVSLKMFCCFLPQQERRINERIRGEEGQEQ